MKAELLEAIRVYVRYETPDKNDETRRMRNERIGEFTPDFKIPETGKYLWDIHRDISSSVSRTNDGWYRLISPVEFQAWFNLTRAIVYPTEYDILCAMDRVFCEEANKELEDVRSKKEDEQKRQMEKMKKRKR